MQSLLNLHCSYGLPLCVSGIAHHLTLSKEMADHDRRREAIKRQRSQARKELHANQDLGTRGNHERVFGEINEGEDNFGLGNCCAVIGTFIHEVNLIANVSFSKVEVAADSNIELQ
ncbi:uncharacterized protein LOC115989249 isoform X3 [Quercus lobata]|uniref:uncharacterized protein LOC115989249 isoform X3 n=1 Tax=Quercus lobata TaxID=97700 RepID=UPI0012493520|nr:uncharacterized protein LOC115989249 isoform X3 [Quercus lobata]